MALRVIHFLGYALIVLAVLDTAFLLIAITVSWLTTPAVLPLPKGTTIEHFGGGGEMLTRLLPWFLPVLLFALGRVLSRWRFTSSLPG